MASNKEHVEQVTLVSQFRKTYPGVRIFAIPNGGYRDAVTGKKLVAEGVSSGVPDLYIPAWKTWVEMKREKGGIVRKEQKDWHEYLIEIGDTVLIGKGWRDAMDKLEPIAKTN